MKKIRSFSMSFSFSFAILFIAISFASIVSTSPAMAEKQKRVVVFAGASATNAVMDVGKLFTEKTNIKVVPSFASSSTLAKQIAQGAPANVYISANPKWMSFLDDKNLIEPGTRRNILGNKLVLIAPAGSSIAKGPKIEIKEGFRLVDLLNGERLAMGDPDHVPAGIYARQALENMGIWEETAPKVVRAKDVRTALLFVERGETPLGIVYATDSIVSKKVKVMGEFPEGSHPPITFQVGIIKENNTENGRLFMEFLKTPVAGKVFEKFGFTLK